VLWISSLLFPLLRYGMWQDVRRHIQGPVPPEVASSFAYAFIIVEVVVFVACILCRSLVRDWIWDRIKPRQMPSGKFEKPILLTNGYLQAGALIGVAFATLLFLVLLTKAIQTQVC